MRCKVVNPRGGSTTAQRGGVQKEYLLSQEDACLILANVKKKKVLKHVCYVINLVKINTYTYVSVRKGKPLEGSTTHCSHGAAWGEITGSLLITGSGFI